MIRELTQRDVERMQVPERYWVVNLDGVTATVEAPGVSLPLRTVIDNYASKMDKMLADGSGLFLYGSNGRGKTASTVVLAMEARRRGYSVLYLETARLKRIVIDKEPFDASTSLWDRALDVDLLVLDDLGKGTSDSKGFMQELVDELLRTRGAHLRATLITTNVDPPRLVTKDEDGILKKSTLAMLQETAAFFMVLGDDHRAERRGSLIGDLVSEK